MTVAGLVAVRQAPETAKGFVFHTLEDHYGLMNIITKPRLVPKLQARSSSARQRSSSTATSSAQERAVNVVAEQHGSAAAGRRTARRGGVAQLVSRRTAQAARILSKGSSMEPAERVKVETTEDMGRTIEHLIADGKPRLLEKDGKVVALILRPDDHDELRTYHGTNAWEGYDPARLRRIPLETGPVYREIDTQQLKKDLREERGQDSRGRPA